MQETTGKYWVGVAVERLGGPTQAAAKLTEATGRKVFHGKVSDWKRKGFVTADWVMLVSDLSGIAPDKLNPKTHGRPVKEIAK